MSGAGALWAGTRRTLEMIRFSHSVFALPFALLSLFIAADGWPPIRILLWVVVAMVAARSAAMGMNRIADRRYDAQNPRTASRHLVTGEISVAFAWGFTAGCALLFVVAAWQINETAFALSPIVLVVLLGYSYLKRFTALAHFGVGLALGHVSPGRVDRRGGGAGGGSPGARGPGRRGPHVGGRLRHHLRRAGRRRGSGAGPALHSGALGGPERSPTRGRAAPRLRRHASRRWASLAGLGGLYTSAVVGVALLLLLEHALVSPTDLSRVNVAFFTMNGLVSLGLGLAGILDVLLR